MYLNVKQDRHCLCTAALKSCTCALICLDGMQTAKAGVLQMSDSAGAVWPQGLPSTMPLPAGCSLAHLLEVLEFAQVGCLQHMIEITCYLHAQNGFIHT